MIEYGKVEAASGVLADSIASLSSRIKLAQGEVTSKQTWPAFQAAFASLSTRIATGIEGWKKGDVITGLPWGIANSDKAWAQLQVWAAELDNLWKQWSTLSGETLPEIAKPTSLISSLGGSVGSTLGGITSIIWAIVALAAVGIVGYVVWRVAR